jgi:hypothetical protein
MLTFIEIYEPKDLMRLFSFQKLLSTFNFISESSNLQRMHSYLNFLQEFKFWGGGIGSTSPAVGRFGNFTGFESFILNTIYELGALFGLGIILISYFLIKKFYILLLNHTRN